MHYALCTVKCEYGGQHRGTILAKRDTPKGDFVGWEGWGGGEKAMAGR